MFSELIKLRGLRKKVEKIEKVVIDLQNWTCSKNADSIIVQKLHKRVEAFNEELEFMKKLVIEAELRLQHIEKVHKLEVDGLHQRAVGRLLYWCQNNPDKRCRYLSSCELFSHSHFESWCRELTARGTIFTARVQQRIIEFPNGSSVRFVHSRQCLQGQRFDNPSDPYKW